MISASPRCIWPRCRTSSPFAIRKNSNSGSPSSVVIVHVISPVASVTISASRLSHDTSHLLASLPEYLTSMVWPSISAGAVEDPRNDRTFSVSSGVGRSMNSSPSYSYNSYWRSKPLKSKGQYNGPRYSDGPSSVALLNCNRENDSQNPHSDVNLRVRIGPGAARSRRTEVLLTPSCLAISRFDRPCLKRSFIS